MKIRRLPPGREVEFGLFIRGRLRIDRGPIFHRMQLVPEIRKLMKEKLRPQIRLMPEKQVSYEFLATVLKAFQKLAYGPHFGFTGVSR